MTKTEIINAQRQAVVAEAITWINTPFHHEAAVKGAGVDCAKLLYASYTATNMIPTFEIEHYPQDWHLHNNDERYLSYILNFAVEMPPEYVPQPGDVVIWKFARSYSHAAIVIDWPNIIHSYLNKTVNIDNIEQTKWLTWIGENTSDNGRRRPYKVFTLKSWIT